MKSVKKLVAAFGLLVLTLCVTISNVSAYDYSKWESIAEENLLDPAFNSGITNADVSINPDQVTFNCTTDIPVDEIDAPTEQFGAFLAVIVGVYRPIAAYVPDVGDLLIVMKDNNHSTVATLSCPKSWVVDLMDNDDAVNQLMMDIFMTMKKV